MTPTTKAGQVLLTEHSSGTPHMERHIIAIEAEARAAALAEITAAVEGLPAAPHDPDAHRGGSALVIRTEVLAAIRKAGEPT